VWSQFPFLAQLLEQPVDLRQVVRGHILDKRTGHFLIANAPVEPAQEQGELHQGCQGERPPVRIELRSQVVLASGVIRRSGAICRALTRGVEGRVRRS
jgi:hypothetical protein